MSWTTGTGRYSLKSLPQGFVNSPMLFSAAITQAFGEVLSPMSLPITTTVNEAEDLATMYTITELILERMMDGKSEVVLEEGCHYTFNAILDKPHNNVGKPRVNTSKVVKNNERQINLDEFGLVEFSVLPDDTLPCCSLLSFDFMSKFKLSLNYMDLTISINNKISMDLGILEQSEDSKIVNKIDFSSPVNYLMHKPNMDILPTLNEGIDVVKGFEEEFAEAEVVGEVLLKEAEGEELIPEEQHLRDLAEDPANRVIEHSFDIVDSNVLQTINIDNNNELISSDLIINNCINSNPHMLLKNNKLIVANDFKRNLKSGIDSLPNLFNRQVLDRQTVHADILSAKGPLKTIQQEILKNFNDDEVSRSYANISDIIDMQNKDAEWMEDEVDEEEINAQGAVARNERNKAIKLLEMANRIREEDDENE
ncbi:unnamed protein product [Rotaria magnacalcarata]|uniref:Reverse transcriptase domain-containing protein n=1 Tax=Rotaria magnacalcarata TaxID=392030 RepID=A0A819YMH0_9BILA|nr:unnamed protein product [Rotaria magnacalcarata]